MLDLARAAAPAVHSFSPTGEPGNYPPIDIAKLPPDGTPAPANYYAAAQGKQGAALLSSLHTIMSTGQVDLGYDGARDAMFGYVDNVNGGVTDIYSGQTFPGVHDRSTANAAGLNTEHTWPQTFGARGIAKDDLITLRPSEITENEQRGDVPYGVVVHPTWTSTPVAGVDGVSELGTDSSGATVFEPLPEMRGQLAYAQFGFFTRYGVGASPADFDPTIFRSELPTLLAWAHAAPPTAADQLRNDKVYAATGTRNPFIDNPALLDQIDWNAATSGASQQAS